MQVILERLALVPPAPGANAYHAFISYSHAADGRLAPALQAGLQRFAKPWYRARELRVFRDQASLSANPRLWTSIERALTASSHFILLASPEAAASPWVAREAETWRQAKSTDTLLIGVTDGEFVWDADSQDFDWERTDALPRTLEGAFAEEPRWIDLRWARDGDHLTLANPRFRDSVAELAAPVHGRPKDELASEELRQHRRTVRLVRAATATFATLTVLAVALSIFALVQRNRAVDERQFSVSRELAAQSLLQLGSDPELSLLLAIESAERRHTAESLAALRRSLSASHLRRTLPGTSVPQSAVAWSQDGRLVAAGDRGGDVRVWDAASGELLHELESDNWDIQSVAFDPTGSRLVAAPREGQAAVWSLSASDTPVVLEEPVDFRVFRAAWSPDGRFVATSGTVTAPVRLWDAESGELLRDFGEPPTSDAAFSPDGSLLATAGADGVARVWQVATGEPVLALQASGEAVGSSAGRGTFVSSVRFSPDGSRLATGGGDGTARVFDVRTGEQVAALSAHSDAVTLVAWSADGEEVATASLDRTARVWSPATELVVTLRAPGAALTTVQFSPDGRYVLTAGDDGLARLFEAGTGVQAAELRGHQGGSVEASFSPDGETVLTGGQDGTARLWEPAFAVPDASPPLPLTSEEALVGVGPGVPQLDPLAEAFLLTRQEEPGAEIRASASGELIARLEGDPSVRSASFDGSGGTLFTATQADFAAQAGRLWDARTGQLLRALSGPGSAAETGVLSDDGSLLATVESSGVVTVWRTATGERVSTFRRHTESEPVYSLFVSTTFSHDGSLLLTGDTAGKAYVWRTRDGGLLNSFEGSPQEPRTENNVPGGAISRDNSLVLFTNPWDQLGRLYRVGSPSQAGVLRGTRTGILSSSFNADGSLIATNGEEGSRVWDVASREPLLVLPGDRGTVAFAGDGRAVVLTPDPRYVSEPSYRLTFACGVCGSIDTLLGLARERASRELTAAESTQYLHR